MPASRSASRDVRPAARSRSLWPMIVIGLAAVVAVIVAALPASIVTHFLPPPMHAEDFSGSIWHGSAGKISVNARDAGALEWRLHPAPLAGLSVVADLHWVKVGFVIDAAVKIDRQGFTARDLKGGGPIEDLRDLGVAAGWSGIADVNFSEIKGDFTKPLAARGDVRVSNLMVAQIAGSADLGGYDLRLADGAVDADGNISAQLMDTGGPLDLQAAIHYVARDRTGTLAGSVTERANVPPALHAQLENLSQLRGPSPQGRIPMDLEFSF